MVTWFQSHIRLKKLPAIALGISLVIMLVQIISDSLSLSIPAPGEMQKYSGKTGQFSVLYPSGWTLNEARGSESRMDPDIVVLIDGPRIPLPGIRIIIRQNQGPFSTLTEVASRGEQINNQRLDYVEVSTQTVLLNGEMTFLREYTFRLPSSPLLANPTMRCLDHYRLHKGIGYILSLCAGTDDFFQIKPTFLQMIDSFTYLQ